MTTNPTFHAPTMTAGPNTSPLIEVDKALESMRDAGFDFQAAVGEPIDNSVEANATTIRIQPKYSKDRKQITEVAFADNGRGIDLAVLPQVLKMGFSTRYNQRKGLGRFGGGLKLAGLSLGRRIEVITKPAGSDKFYSVFIDLDLISKGSQKLIEAVEVDGWPAGYEDLMTDAEDKPFLHGTLVLWKKVDRLTGGGSYMTSLDSKIDDLRKFIARVYRRFLDQGLVIELDGKPVVLHDPLFQLDDPRIIKRYAGRPVDQIKGRIVEEGPAGEVYDNPQHDYTKRLLKAVPIPDPKRRRTVFDVPTGEIPSPVLPLGQSVERVRYHDVGDRHLVAVA